MIHKITATFSLLFLGIFSAFSQESHIHTHDHSDSPLEFIKNSGQWDQNILFESKFENGSVYLEQGGFTFSQTSAEDLVKLDELNHMGIEHWRDFKLNAHAWKVNFVSANLTAAIDGKDKIATYHNYFLGNDQSRWAGNVPVFYQAYYHDLYVNIDLKTYSVDGHFKYDFIVHPGADVRNLQMKYEGLDGMKIVKGNLQLETSVGAFMEMAPYAYQIIEGKEVKVPCKYVLSGNKLTYAFPKGYDAKMDLIIDPTLIGASLSGSSGTNYGHAATFDNAGNIYAGARNFSSGYPATVGAFQFVAGGGQDIAISKMSPNASALIYATHLGGSSSDLPHSMFVSAADELYILGTTSSTNFPVSTGAFDVTLGGTQDIVLTHFNTTGTGIIGSTFVGGSGSDGTNSVTSNYGDNYRGEIIVDPAGNCLVACESKSVDFPVTAGAYQTTHGGLGDAVVFKMNPGLTAMTWATYLGGTGNDSGFGLRIDNAGDIFVCGATEQSFMTATGHQPNHAGLDDGFIVKLINNGGGVGVSTYVGTAANDNAFFIDLDGLGRVYVYGQTAGGTMTTTAASGTYNNPSSQQYINRFDPTLATRDISSLIGSGSSGTFVPIAFMVDYCGYIYFSGHSASSFSVLPLSSNALQTTGGFYIGVLDPNATGLNYATRFGGNGDHVDGGTSRFDPSGIVYQSVCTSNGFNPTAGAYSTTYPSGYDIGVFKIDFEANPVAASATFTTNTMFCSPMTVNFTNTGQGSDFSWDFGDGSALDTAASPTHVYTSPGTFNVTLVANDTSACATSDTAYFSIVVPGPFTVDLGPDVNLCNNETETLAWIFPNATYLWQDGSTNSTFEVTVPGTYYVTVTIGPCVASDTVVVNYVYTSVDLGPDQFICSGDAVTLDAGTSGVSYLWSDNSTAQTLVTTTPGVYMVTISDGTCSDMDTIIVSSETTIPYFNVTDTIGCDPFFTQFTDSSITSSVFAGYYWEFGDGANSSIQHPTHQYQTSGNYLVQLTVSTINGCQYTYSRFVSIQITPQPMAHFSFLPEEPKSGEEIQFTDESSNAVSWLWDFNDGTTSTNQNPVHVYYDIETFEVVLTVENNGCSDSFQANITFADNLIYYVPNAFTPDNDGFNHVFQPVFTAGFSPQKYYLTIYNRWGETVFESYDHTMPWDGTYDGVVCPQGIYTWKIFFGEQLTDKKHSLTGHVTLIK